MNYFTYVTIATLQKIHELKNLAFICDGDSKAVTSVEDEE